MKFFITNFKISFKCPLLPLDNVLQIAKENQIDTKEYNNFIVFTNVYQFIIFKAKNDSNHVNVTKLSSRKKISQAVELFEKIFLCKTFSLSIDNIIAVCQISSYLNLSSISKKNKKNLRIKYNSEKFPGLFIKFKEGTTILFHSGKVVIVGCKTEARIECLLQQLTAHI